MPPVDAAHFINLHDIGMHQLGGSLGLVLEAANIGLIAGQFPLQYFEGYLPLERKLLGQINIGHRPAPSRRSN